jgi:hypothetical protein
VPHLFICGTVGSDEMNLDETIMDLSGYRLRRSPNPLLDYSLFDPISEAEWKRLEADLRFDEMRYRFALEVNEQKSPEPGETVLSFATFVPARTVKGQPILLTVGALFTGPNRNHAGSQWFAGVASTEDGEKQYFEDAERRIESLLTGEGKVFEIGKLNQSGGAFP